MRRLPLHPRLSRVLLAAGGAFPAAAASALLSERLPAWSFEGVATPSDLLSLVDGLDRLPGGLRQAAEQIAALARSVLHAGPRPLGEAELLRRMLEMERLASLGGLTTLYVHDLKTPLMMVNVTLDEMRAVAEAVPALHSAIDQAPIDSRVKTRLLEKVDTTPGLIDDPKQAATTIQGMIGVLWEFIKPGTGRGEPPVIDPLPIIQHTLSMYQRVTVHSSAQITYRGPKELPRVRMSPVDLTQVLVNLVGNATQAVAARGESYRLVAVNARHQGDMLELQVRDDGVGMPPCNTSSAKAITPS